MHHAPVRGSALDRLPRPARGQSPDLSPQCRVALLGGFRLVVDGRAGALPAASQRLVALLALEGRSTRSRVAGTLWPDSSEERALASLRTVIWRVNQVAPGVVVTANGSLDLGSSVQVDVRCFLESATVLMRDPHSGTEWQDLVGAGGELLADWSDDWLLPHRQRLRQLQMHLLETASEELSSRGRFGIALEAALAVLRADPLRESAHRAVIRVHVAEGNVVEARRAFVECRSLLRRELGVAPSPQTVHVLDGAGDGRDPVPPPQQQPAARRVGALQGLTQR